MVSDKWSYKDTGGTTEWRPDLSLEDVSVTKSHVVAFVGNQILIILHPNREGYQLPGGTIEDGETPEEALEREAWEEANIKLENISLLGIEEIRYEKKPHPKKGEKEYIAKFMADVDELSSVTPDPAEGDRWERKLVDPLEDISWVLDAFYEDDKVRTVLLRKAERLKNK